MTKTQPCLAKSLTGNYRTAGGDVYPRYTTVVLSSGICCRRHPQHFTFHCHLSRGLCGTYWLCSTTWQDAAFSVFVYWRESVWFTNSNLTISDCVTFSSSSDTHKSLTRHLDRALPEIQQLCSAFRQCLSQVPKAAETVATASDLDIDAFKLFIY